MSVSHRSLRAARRAARLLVPAALAVAGACHDALVGASPILGVILDAGEIVCTVGDTVVLRASVEGGDGTGPALTYRSSDPATVVPLDSATPGTPARVHCVGPGRASVAVSAAAAGRRGVGVVPVTVMAPQTLVLLATPKLLPDFDAPEAAVDRFLAHYEPLARRAARTIVVFAVGNSEHVLTYHGRAFWRDTIQWAHFTDGKPGPPRTMRYTHLPGIVRAFRERGAARGLAVEVYDQVDPGDEFTWEFFKFNRHPECMDLKWRSWNVRGRLKHDAAPYASAPHGIADGTSCGTFLVDQVNAYLADFGFDGILYGNQLGTRGRWLPDNGPGWSDDEARAIEEFLAYSRRVYGDRGLIWFDSYNETRVERDVFSFPPQGYRHFDYLLAAGFAVVSVPERYLANLRSKLDLPGGPPVLATLDYVDPWYTYDSMTAYPIESARLEQAAIAYRHRVAGLFLFAHDEVGALVPRSIVESFAARFFGPG